MKMADENPPNDIVLTKKHHNLHYSETPPQNTLCPTRFGCQGNTRAQCEGIIRQYQEQIDDDIELIEEEPESHEPQILRHVVLLILLLCSMFVGIALCIWTLVMEKTSGIYIELSFLDATLNFGQSIIVFAVFGLDSKAILLPVLKYWRKFFCGGANTLTLPTWHELTPETRHICDQFVNHHIKACKQAIAKDKRWGLKTYRNVFSGVRFVDWLIEVGLARDRVEAVNYARHLIEGKVLKHINSVHHFYDRNLLYTFV